LRLDENIVGRSIRFRIGEPADAEFVLSLRLDPELSRYLKPVDPSVEKQREWIKAKQSEQDDYHMIIESHEGERYGVIALYDVKGDTFDWGRWVISREAPKHVAFESMLLIYQFGFLTLGLGKTMFEVRKRNNAVIAYHQHFGAKIRGEDDTYVWFQYTKRQFLEQHGARLQSPRQPDRKRTV
jgi:RimJ/RimL family protein N-acetyltransferase